MRLYAFLLVAVAALHVRAATIPASETDKKLIDIVPDNIEKVPENTSSENELIDQTNSIKDVENKLRVKPENIPVEVIVENVQPALKAEEEKDNSEEINRPVPDLRNPGPPQRQEHETQNPEYHASEQQTVLLFKQSINDAQNFLRQGFQGVADGIQNMIASNEPIETIQKSIQALREGFTSQINKLNGTIQNYINNESSSVNELVVENTKAGFQQIEQGLFKLRNDFNRGVNTLADGVGIVASLKADNENPTENNPSSGATSAPANPSSPAPAPVLPFVQYVQNIQHALSSTFQNMTETINRLTGQAWNSINPQQSTASSPTAVQADSQVTPAPSAAPPASNPWQNLSQQFSGLFPQPGSGPLGNMYQNIVAFFQGQNAQGALPAPTPASPASQPAQSAPKPSETANKPETSAEPAKPAISTETQAAAVTPNAGPIRQILQNNPITKGIAGAVQRLQNINNPEKPRDVVQPEEEDKKPEEIKPDNEPKKGGGPNAGDNNDSSDSGDSRIEQNEPVKEDSEMSPEVEKIEEMNDQKTEEVVDKTE